MESRKYAQKLSWDPPQKDTPQPPIKPQAHVYAAHKLGIHTIAEVDVLLNECGGKGISLSIMSSHGLPVPEAAIIPASLHREILDDLRNGKPFNMYSLTASVFKRLGPKRDVSVRSGARVSMPGMLDTVLGVPKDASALAEAILKVWRSWFSERAVAYRKVHSIGDIGTAVIIQDMVYGDGPGKSGTGVAFSVNPVTGKRVMTGEWLPGHRGDAIVGGTATPLPLRELKRAMPDVYAMLREGVRRMAEDGYMKPVEVEFTVEDGDLYFLQCRPAKVAERKTRKRKLKKGNVVLKGLSGSPGVATGRVLTPHQAAKYGPPYILMCEFTSPDDFPVMQHASAIVTAVGGITCHAVIVARELGIPCIVGCGDIPVELYNHESLTVDADRGIVEIEHA